MNFEEAERWIVNLVQNVKLDAKVDSKLTTVVMDPTSLIVRSVLGTQTRGRQLLRHYNSLSFGPAQFEVVNIKLDQLGDEEVSSTKKHSKVMKMFKHLLSLSAEN